MATTKVQAELIATNAISGTIIADNAITGVHIAQNAILTQHIDDGQVGTSQLAADAVTGAKLADSSVVTANIQDDQVTSDKLANNIQIAGTLGVTGETTLSDHLNIGDSIRTKIGAGPDLELWHDSNNSIIKNSTGNLYLRSDNNIVFQDAGGNETFANFADNGVVTLYHDNSAKLATASGGVSVTGYLTASGHVSTNADTGYLRAGASNDILIYHDGSHSYLKNNTGDFTIDAVGNITLDADGGSIGLNDAGTHVASLEMASSSNLYIETKVSDGDILLRGNDGGSTITALTLDMSAAGAATFNSTVTASGLTVGNSNIGSNTSHLANLTINNNAYIGSAGNTTAIKIATSGAVTMGYADLTITADNARLLVEEADGTDIAVIGDITGAGVGGMFLYNHGGTALVQLRADANNSFINNGANFGIGTASPNEELHLKGAASNYATFKIESGSTTHGSIIEFADATDANYGEIIQFASSAGEGGRMKFTAGATETMNLRGGKVGIGASNPAELLHVYGATGDATKIKLQSAGSASTDDVSITFGNHQYDWSIGTNQSAGGHFQIARHETLGNYVYFTVLGNNGKIGMGGQTSPAANLEVIDSGGGNVIAIGTGHSDGSVRGYWGYSASGNTSGWHVGSAYNNDAARYDIRMKGGSASDAKLTVLGSGNVGIGHTDPESSLEVGGTGIQINDGTAGTTPKLVFGTEPSTNAAAKCIFMNSYWLTLQGHRNEGIKMHGVNASGTVQEFLRLTGDNNSDASEAHFFSGGGGQVGINDDSPITELTIGGNINGRVGIHVWNANTTGQSAYTQLNLGHERGGFTGGYISHHYDGLMKVWNRDNDPMIFGTNDAERVRIDDNGRVGIGTDDPQAMLEVAGPIVFGNVNTDSRSGITDTYNNVSVVGAGDIILNTGVALSNDSSTCTITWAKGSWAAINYDIEYSVASTAGRVAGGGYHNGSGGTISGHQEAVLYGSDYLTITGSGQTLIFTIAFAGNGHHPHVRARFSSSGGAGVPDPSDFTVAWTNT